MRGQKGLSKGLTRPAYHATFKGQVEEEHYLRSYTCKCAQTGGGDVCARLQCKLEEDERRDVRSAKRQKNGGQTSTHTASAEKGSFGRFIVRNHTYRRVGKKRISGRSQKNIIIRRENIAQRNPLLQAL
jgi:hypothetical protein